MVKKFIAKTRKISTHLVTKPEYPVLRNTNDQQTLLICIPCDSRTFKNGKNPSMFYNSYNVPTNWDELIWYYKMTGRL